MSFDQFFSFIRQDTYGFFSLISSLYYQGMALPYFYKDDEKQGASFD